MLYKNKDILNLVWQDIPNGIHTYTCTKNNIDIPFEMINVDGDISDALSHSNDVYDEQMLIIKHPRQILVNKDLILTPKVRKKGLVIFTKLLINAGRISMQAKGADAEGQDVYLYKDQFIPANGAIGGAIARLPYNVGRSNQRHGGNTGGHGINRQSGGGGSGGIYGGYYTTTASYAGAGSQGTSYSGGAGGGGCSTETTSAAISSYSANGLRGGDAVMRGDGNWTRHVMGGLGVYKGGDVVNGRYGWIHGYNQYFNLGLGTGGLMIIIANDIINCGEIESDGSSMFHAGTADGGCSGGGSVNIITGRYISYGGTVHANGGTCPYGGNGGNGCVTIDQGILKSYIRNNTDIFKNIHEQNSFDMDKLFGVMH